VQTLRALLYACGLSLNITAQFNGHYISQCVGLQWSVLSMERAAAAAGETLRDGSKICALGAWMVVNQRKMHGGNDCRLQSQGRVRSDAKLNARSA